MMFSFPNTLYEFIEGVFDDLGNKFPGGVFP